MRFPYYHYTKFTVAPVMIKISTSSMISSSSIGMGTTMPPPTGTLYPPVAFEVGFRVRGHNPNAALGGTTTLG